MVFATQGWCAIRARCHTHLRISFFERPSVLVESGEAELLG